MMTLWQGLFGLRSIFSRQSNEDQDTNFESEVSEQEGSILRGTEETSPHEDQQHNSLVQPVHPGRNSDADSNTRLHQESSGEDDMIEVMHSGADEGVHDQHLLVTSTPQNTVTLQQMARQFKDPERDNIRQLATLKGKITRLTTDINNEATKTDIDERRLYTKAKTLIEDFSKLKNMWTEYINNLDASLHEREEVNLKKYSDKVRSSLYIAEGLLYDIHEARTTPGEDLSQVLHSLFDPPEYELTKVDVHGNSALDVAKTSNSTSTGRGMEQNEDQDRREDQHEILPVIVHEENFQPFHREENINKSQASSRRSSNHSIRRLLQDDHQILHKALNPEIREAVRALGIDQTKADFSSDDLEQILHYCAEKKRKSQEEAASQRRLEEKQRDGKEIVVTVLGKNGGSLLDRPPPQRFQRSIAANVPDRIDRASDEESKSKSKNSVGFKKNYQSEDYEMQQAIEASKKEYEEFRARRSGQSNSTSDHYNQNLAPSTSSLNGSDTCDHRLQTMENNILQLTKLVEKIAMSQVPQATSAKSSIDAASPLPDLTCPPPPILKNSKHQQEMQRGYDYATQSRTRWSSHRSDLPRPSHHEEPLSELSTRSSSKSFAIPPGLTDWSQPTEGRRWVNEDRHLPRAEMSKFSGDRLKYPLWRSQMIIMIDQKAISNEAKCNLVIQSLEGEALLYGESFLRAGIKSDSYYKLISMLDDEYGGDDRMRENQLKRLKDFGQVRDFSLQNLKALNLLFSDAKKFLQEFDPNSVIQRKSMVYLLARDCLPDIQMMHFGRWIRDNCLDENFCNLERWIKREYEAARDMRENAKPYESGVDFVANKVDKKKKIISNRTFFEEQEDFYADEGEEIQLVQTAPAKRPLKFEQKRPTADVSTVKAPCCLCKKQHDLVECQQFRDQTQRQRMQTVKTNRICFHCLLPGHRVSQCRIAPGRKCGINGCTRYHHLKLHTDSNSTLFSIEEIIDDVYIDPTSVDDSNEEQMHANSENGEVYIDQASNAQPREYYGIRSAILYISNGKKTRRILAALDSCSNNTNISAELAKQLDLQVIKSNIPRRVNGMRSSVIINSAAVKFSLMPLDKSQEFEVSAYTVENFMEGTAVVDWAQSVSELDYLQEIGEYPNLWKGAKFDLLLGTDYADLMVSNKSLKGPRGSAVAELTDLGWAFSGPAPKSSVTNLVIDSPAFTITSMTVMLTTVEDHIDKLLYRQWDLDEIGMKEEAPNFSNAVKNPKIPWSSKEIEADEKMKTVFVPEKGVYQISIPWKEKKPNFVSNFNQVKNRQDRVIANLERSGTSKEQVQSIFEDYIGKGYVRRVSGKEAKEKDSFYLPWFPVVDKSRETTKCRIVFDAAARDRFNRSLNSEIEVTPNRLNNLFDILLRFRQYEFCMSADVSEMFLRIMLDPKDRRYHRFVCGDDVMEWQSMLFGNQSSPNGSQKVLHQNCQDHGGPFPEAVKTITQSTYMDDAIDSRETEDEIAELVIQLPALLSFCNMKIQKFYSNSRKAMEAIPEELRSKSIVFEDKDIIYEDNKILGMMYSGDENDVLHFSSKFESKTEWQLRKTKVVINVWTKRLALRVMASIYDPLGLLAPFKIRAQVLIQRMWRKKIDWDTPIGQELDKEWDAWLDGIFDLKNIKTPRWLGLASSNLDRQLHVFVDASEEAFAACVYTRIVQHDGSIVTNLVTAKARVTPLKSESISRMELVACVLGTRLARAVLNVLQIDRKKWFMWTDSQVCLHWIITPAKAFKAYVANRCGEIQSCTEQSQWKHVPTDQNPADIATRSISTQDLISSRLWWKGPEFLQKPQEEWPETKLLRVDPSINLEEKSGMKGESLLLSTQSETYAMFQKDLVPSRFDRMKPENWSVSYHFNGYKKCLTRWYYIREAFRVWKIRTFEKSNARIMKPTINDLRETKIFLIRQSQMEWFGEFFDGDRILEGRIPKELRKFKPFVDENNLLRSQSRLSGMAHLDFSQRFPVLLHRKSGFARLVAWYLHFQLDHPVGHRAFVAALANEYAIHGIGTLCQIVKRECFTCRKEKARAATQEMANLPHFRLELGCQAFQNTGLDYCGPFHVKFSRGRAKKKVWILVLTCLQIRAVHLEVVAGQDTSSFINAMSRFCDVRGVPKFILSDNQTCFRGAEKEFQEWRAGIDWDLLQETTGFGWKGSQGIEWKFNPPLAPHFGGIFETIVKAAKRGLKKTLEQTDLDEEEFRTAVSHVMYLLNRRPITTLGDYDDDIPLTPNDFLMAHSAGHILPPLPEGAYSLSQKWKLVQKRVDEFWKRFIKEMLATLQPRKKWSESQENLQVDDVVLEIDSNLPRGQWRMLRVKELLPSPDGLVRKVIVVNSNGKAYERAIHRLIPIVPN